MAIDKGVECRIVPAEQHADITSAGAGGLVDEVIDHRSIRQFIVTSIEYAEIVVNTEPAQDTDVVDVFLEDPVGCTLPPGVAHACGGT